MAVSVGEVNTLWRFPVTDCQAMKARLDDCIDQLAAVADVLLVNEYLDAHIMLLRDQAACSSGRRCLS